MHIGPADRLADGFEAIEVAFCCSSRRIRRTGGLELRRAPGHLKLPFPYESWKSAILVAVKYHVLAALSPDSGQARLIPVHDLA